MTEDVETTGGALNALAEHRWYLALFALLGLLLAYSWMSTDVTAPNERSRIYLTMSIVDSGSIIVDDQVDKFGLPFDIAERDGHYYTDKAPGSSLLAVPLFWTYTALGGDTTSIEDLVLLARFGVMLPITLASLVLFWLILTRLGLSRRLAAAMTATLALGTVLFHYGTAFYGHTIVLLCTLLAVFCIFKNLQRDGPSTLHWPLIAGLAAGTAFAVEYQAVIVFAAVALGFLSVPGHRRVGPVAALCAGAALPVLIVFAYHTAAFGHPLTTSYDFLIHDAPVEHHDAGLWGVSFIPSLEAIYGLLFSPSRGLLMCAPLVLVGLAGIPALLRRCRWLGIVTAVCAGGYLWMATSADDVWFAGWSFGPRLLIPMFGLVAIAGAVAYDKLRTHRPYIASALLGIFVAAIGYVVFVTVMFPELPPTVTAPAPSVAAPLAMMGAPSPNLGMWFGLKPLASLIPLAVGVIAVAAFIVAAAFPGTESGNGRRWATVIVAGLVFTAVAWGYPENVPDDRLDDFVERRAAAHR